MVLLKKQSKKEARKDQSFLGLAVPGKISHHLSLYCMAKGITKTSVMLELLNNWHSVQEKSTPQLIELIALRAYNVFATSKRKDINQFCTTLSKELTGLSNEVTEKVIELVYEKNKNIN